MTSTASTTRASRWSNGQGLVEFALILPILLFAVMGIFDFGRVLIGFSMASNAVRDALRQATIVGYYSDDPAAYPPYRDCDLLRDTAGQGFFLSGTVTVTYFDQDNVSTGNLCSDTPFDDPYLGQIKNGDILQVSYQGEVRLVTPLISALVPVIPVSFTGHRTLVTEIILHGNTEDCVDDTATVVNECDLDGDGRLNKWDPQAPPELWWDVDFDGLPDWWEDWHFGNRDGIPTASELVLYGASDDPDGDGCPNGCEATRLSDPINPIGSTDPRLTHTYTGTDATDTDGDGLDDREEAYVYATDPTLQDTDDDCLRDDVEVDPATFAPDFSRTNPREDDTDGDGLLDGEELGLRCKGSLGSGPIRITDPKKADSDYDVVNDISDGLDDRQELLGFDIPGYGMCYPDPWNRDTDGDGTLDGDEIIAGRNPCQSEIPALSITNVFVVEGGTAVFEVTLSNWRPDPTLSPEVTVTYATLDGTATAGADYMATSGTLTFTPSTMTQTISVVTSGDSSDEVDETFLVQLSGVTSSVTPVPILAGSGEGTGTIDDDNNPTISIEPNVSVSESAGTISFTVELSASSVETITVQYATADGTARAGSDYTPASSGTVTFNPQETSGSITVSIVNDLSDEDDETFTIGLFNAVNAAVAAGSATATITDDDLEPSVTIAGPASPVAESMGSAAFTVTVSPASGKTVTVDYATSDGSASAGADYSAVSNSLTFAPGQTSQTVNVSIANDALDETDEDFRVTLTNPVSATLGSPISATATIDDDDGPSISVADVSAPEDAGTLAFTVSLSVASAQTITVDYATLNGSATAGSDYVATNGTLTFAPGETSKTISVTITEDVVDEPNEVFSVSLSNPTDASLADGMGTATITDNDEPPQATITAAASAVAESDGSVTFTVTLSGIAAQPVTVNYSTGNGTAASPADFTANSGTLTFAPGEISKAITVNITNDSIDEANETFSVTLSGPTNATIGSPGSAVVTITDNDGPTIRFNDTAVTVLESAGTVSFNVVLRCPGNCPSPQTITVNYATANGSATAGSDYTATSGTLTFAPGETSKTITVPILEDTLDEIDETVTLSLSTAVNGTIDSTRGTATLTIDDNDGPTISLSAGGSGPESSGTASFTVTLSASSLQPVSVDYATANDTATAGSDYTTTTGTLTFPVGTTSRTITVPITNDLSDEVDETFRVTLSNPIDGALDAAATTGIWTILDDDDAPTVTISGSAAPRAESAGTATFTVTLSVVSGKPVTVNYATAEGTATAGADFTAIPNGTLLIDPGTVSRAVSVNIVNDTLDEVDETFSVELTGATNAVVGTPASASAIIDDNDGPTINVSSGSVTEGGSIVFTVSLSSASVQPVSVDYATANDTATAGSDYTATTGTLNFAGGETSKTVLVTTLSDTLDEDDETFTLALSNTVDAMAGGPGTGTILDDDAAPSVSVADSNITEGNSGTSTLAFAVSLSEASGRTVSVDYATTDDTAIAGADYTAVSGTVTFSPGETNQTINVLILGERVDEDTESFTVQLSKPLHLDVARATATGTILDDDDAPLVTIANTSANEGNPGADGTLRYTVSLSAPSSRAITVDYALTGGTAIAGSDYTAVPDGTLTFLAGQASAEIGVPLISNALDEVDVTVIVTLSNPVNATLGVPSTATGTILDDDPPPVVSVVASPTSITEGDIEWTSMTFTVSLSTASAKTITMSYATANGTATAGSDYAAASGTLVFAPGETTQSVSVSILGDRLDENDETFTFSLSNLVNVAGSAAVTATILDDDATPSLSIQVNPASVLEGANGTTTSMTFTVSLSAVSGRNVTVQYAITGTATAGNDFTYTTSPNSSGTFTFVPGNVTAMVAVTVSGDNQKNESDETIIVTLINPVNATIATASATGTIRNDD